MRLRPLLIAGLVRTRSQLTQTGVLLASFLVRPLVALALGVAAYYLLPPLHGRAYCEKTKFACRRRYQPPTWSGRTTL